MNVEGAVAPLAMEEFSFRTAPLAQRLGGLVSLSWISPVERPASHMVTEKPGCRDEKKPRNR